VDEEDVVEQTEFFQQGGADEAVKVRTGYQAVTNGGSRGSVHTMGLGSPHPGVDSAAEYYTHRGL
jgi:hypothetical protein